VKHGNHEDGMLRINRKKSVLRLIGLLLASSVIAVADNSKLAGQPLWGRQL